LPATSSWLSGSSFLLNEKFPKSSLVWFTNWMKAKSDLGSLILPDWSGSGGYERFCIVFVPMHDLAWDRLPSNGHMMLRFGFVPVIAVLLEIWPRVSASLMLVLPIYPLHASAHRFFSHSTACPGDNLDSGPENYLYHTICLPSPFLPGKWNQSCQSMFLPGSMLASLLISFQISIARAECHALAG
jgi:hypothetical protein